MQGGSILIIVAMKKEANKLIRKIENIREENVLNYKVYSGIFNNHLVNIGISGVGEINSSSATTALVMKTNPSLILNYGVSGAHKKEINTLDIIIGTKILNINSMITNENEKRLVTFSEEKDETNYLENDNNMIEIAKKAFKSYEFGRVYQGIIGSGDVWNKDKKWINYLNKNYGTICEEMEGIGISTISHKENIPYFEFRVISNNELNSSFYDKKAETICQEQMQKLLESI